MVNFHRGALTAEQSEIVARIAADMIRFDIVNVGEREALRSLMNAHRYGDLVAFLDDARDVARATIKGAA